MSTPLYTANISMKRLLVMALLGIPLGGVGVAVLHFRYDYHFIPSLLCILVWLVAILGPILTVLGLLAMIIRRGLALRLTPQSFEFKMPQIGMVALPWKEIVRFEMHELFSTRSLKIYMTDPDRYTANYTGIAKKSVELNRNTLGTPFVVTISLLDKPFEEVKAKIEEFHRQFGPR